MLRHRFGQVLRLRGSEGASSTGKSLGRESTWADAGAAVAGSFTHAPATATASRTATAASAIHGVCTRHGAAERRGAAIAARWRAHTINWLALRR